MQSARSRPPVARWIVWSIRITVTAHLVSVLAQAVLAGLFITGDVDLLRIHSINGQVASGLIGLQLVAAILLWRPGRGVTWPMWLSLVLTILEGVQHMTGFSRSLDLHIPLGMLIFGMSTVMLVWAFGRPDWWTRGPSDRTKTGETLETPATEKIKA